MAEPTKSTKLIIGPGRLSFPKIFEPNSKEYGGKYQATLLLPPGYDFGPLKKIMLDVAIAKFGPDKAKWPRGLRGPSDVIRDCAEKSNMAGYDPGWHFVSAASSDQPGVVDGALTKTTDPRDAYPGRWAKMSVNVFAYSNVKHGVSLGLQNVQLLAHDDPFSSQQRPEDEFEAMYEEMDDADRSSSGDDFPDKSSSGEPSNDDWGS